METYDQNGLCVHGLMLCQKCLPSSAPSPARTAVLETIGHLQALAVMAQTETQRTTALRLAARLASVLPPVDDTPSNCPSVESQGKKGDQAAPGTGVSGHLESDPNTADARRYRWLLANPEPARHLLLLLQQGKGDEEAFTTMVDRIMASTAAAKAAT